MANDRLTTVWDRLLAYYTEAEARTWVCSPHPQLAFETPAVLLAKGDADPLHAILDRLDSDGYL